MNSLQQQNETSAEPALIHAYWQKQLDQREHNRQKRRLRTPLAIDFCSNDYLGMARALDHSEIKPNDHPFAQRMAGYAYFAVLLPYGCSVFNSTMI